MKREFGHGSGSSKPAHIESLAGRRACQWPAGSDKLGLGAEKSSRMIFCTVNN